MEKDKPEDRQAGSMSRHQKVLIGIAIAFLLYSMAGFWLLPAVAMRILERQLTENLQRQVTIETIQFNPYLFKILVKNFLVQDRAAGNHLVTFEELFVDLEAASVLKRALVIKTLTLTGPRVHLARYKDLSYNFSDIAESAGAEEKTDSKPFLFSVNNIEIKNGEIVFVDEPKETTHRIDGLNIAIPFLSNVAHEVEIRVQPAFAAVVNGAPLILSGRTIPFHDSRSTVFDIRLSEINIPAYLAYLPQRPDLTLQTGFLDIAASLAFEMRPGNNPAITLAGDFAMTEIDIVAAGNETYLAIPRLEIKLAESRLLENDYHFSLVSLAEPEFLLRRDRSGDILPLTLLQEKKTAPPPAKPKSGATAPAVKLVVDEIMLSGGTLRFEDLSNAEPFNTTMRPIEIKVTNLSTLEDAEASYDIAMQTESRETIAMNGRLRLNPLAVDMHLDLQDLRIPRFSPYYNEIVMPQVADGSLDLAAELTYSRAGDNEILRADNISARLDSLVINDRDDRELLAIPALSSSGGSWDPAGRQLVIGDFLISGGQLHLVRQKEGLVILQELLRPRETRDDEPAAAAAVDTQPPWALTLRKGAIEQFSVVLLDQIPAEPTTLLFDNLSLTAENISTAANSQGTVDLRLRIDRKGQASIKGPLGIDPLSTSLAVKLADLQVKTLQPYFADTVNLVISDGAISMDGQLKVSQSKGKELATFFQGNAGVANFASFDPVAGEDFLNWQDLRLAEMHYDSGSAALRIKQISWQDFYNKITVFDTGALNLNAILPAREEPAPGAAESGEPEAADGKALLVEIDAVELANGIIEFLDRNITPNYASSFSELSGTITGLSSRPDVMATVNISGRLDEHAPLQITGTVNPLRDEFFADLIFDFNDIELSPTSPYTGKYIGYTVAKGKLSLDLHYLVDGRKIIGRNEAFLDQFTLGETVESPDALKLPLSLAIALLKNRRGEITLNVPVKGNLDDPEFSIGGIVFRAIVNLIAKAATSPFALLGALIPEGGEDLQHVEFAPGSAELAAESADKLAVLAKALFDRPGLKMDIKGSVAADEERAVLHEKRFAQLLKNEKYKELAGKKEDAPPVDEIVIEPDEYETYLTKAYKAAEFEKPKNFLGLAKRLPPEEMEKLLQDNITITRDDLRLLAIARASAVKSFLVETGPVEPERLFIVEPEIAAGESGGRQVEMIIK